MIRLGKDKAGFIAYQLLLVVLVVAIIAFVSWSAWKSRALTTMTKISPPPPVTVLPAGSSGIKGGTFYGAATGCYSPNQSSSCGGPRPVQAVIEVWVPVSGGTDNASRESATSNKIASVSSDAKGNFSVNLPAGRYFLLPQPLPDGQVASSQTVVVSAGQYAQVTFVYN